MYCGRGNICDNNSTKGGRKGKWSFAVLSSHSSRSGVINKENTQGNISSVTSGFAHSRSTGDHSQVPQ